MGQLTEQVIKQWEQLSAPSPFKPDIKSSYLKTAIKSEILTPSHAVSIAPFSYKVEVDPFVFSDQFIGLPPSVAKIHQALCQSIEIKQLLKLSLKGEKEVTFKTKSTVEYGSNEDDQSKAKTKTFVSLAVASSALVAIAGEILASKKLKDEQKYLWIAHAALSRLLFMVFNWVVRAKITLKGPAVIPPPDPNAPGPDAQAPVVLPDVDQPVIDPAAQLAALALAAPDNAGVPNQGQALDLPVALVEGRADGAEENPGVIPPLLQMDEDANNHLVEQVDNAQEKIAEVRADFAVDASGVCHPIAAD